MSSMPACPAPVKIEMTDYEHSNSYGEPPPKRPNTAPNSSQNLSSVTSTASRNQTSGGTADANVTLWQFLLDLLLKQQYSNIICWTNNEGEFKLLDAEQVAKLWGLKKNKNNMNYDKLSRALRYYYDKNIIKKVMGQKFVYKFVSFPEMVKTENRIPFKKKMESIVNDSNSNAPSAAAAAATSLALSSFQTLRPYDVKSGLIQQAQQLAAVNAANALAVQAQHHLLHQQAVAHAMIEQKYQVPHDQHVAASAALYHSDSSQTKFSQSDNQASSRSPTPNMMTSSRHSPAPVIHAQPSSLTFRNDLVTQPSPSVTPVSVCTPAASPSPTPVFDIPGSGTPTPPPKPATPNNRETEVKVKLEIPEIDVNKNCGNVENGNIEGRRSSKQSKLKPDPLSINNDVVVNPSVTSPLMTRGLLPSLNTPMFLTSPMFGHGQRTPLIPGIHFWGPGTLSPVTLSPRFGGLHASSAFQFPGFSVSPATLASFSSFHDSIFTSAAATNSSLNSDKR